MANGVTMHVKDGSITGFNDFLRVAAEYYGLPDSPITVDKAFIPREEDTRQLSEAKRKLEEVRQLTNEKASHMARAYFEKQHQSYKKAYARQIVIETRYNRMITQAYAWEPPAEEHNDFKQYMLKQLRAAIARDVHVLTEPQLMTGVEFKEVQIKLCEEAVAQAHRVLEGRRREHETKVRLANYWNVLRESLDNS